MTDRMMDTVEEENNGKIVMALCDAEECLINAQDPVRHNSWEEAEMWIKAALRNLEGILRSIEKAE